MNHTQSQEGSDTDTDGSLFFSPESIKHQDFIKTGIGSFTGTKNTWKSDNDEHHKFHRLRYLNKDSPFIND